MGKYTTKPDGSLDTSKMTLLEIKKAKAHIAKKLGRKKGDLTVEAVERIIQLEIDNDGELKASDVVDDASNPHSPLHTFFEWDDTKAAHEHRLHQARNLIARIKVDVVIDRRTVAIPRYVRDPTAAKEQREGYVQTASLRDNKDRARDAMAREIGRILSAIERAEGVAVSLGMKTDLDYVRQRVERMEKLLKEMDQ